jgi:hypothetical protein
MDRAGRERTAAIGMTIAALLMAGGTPSPRAAFANEPAAPVYRVAGKASKKAQRAARKATRKALRK